MRTDQARDGTELGAMLQWRAGWLRQADASRRALNPNRNQLRDQLVRSAGAALLSRLARSTQSGLSGDVTKCIHSDQIHSVRLTATRARKVQSV